MAEGEKSRNDNKRKSYEITTDKNFMDWWSKVRGAGKQTYAIRGALIFSALFNLFREIVFSTLFNRGDYKFNINHLLLNLVFISIVMYGYKMWNWKVNEKRFQRLSSEQKT